MVIRVNQGAVVDRTALGENQRAGSGGIEVRQVVFRIRDRRREIIPEAKIHCEFRSHLKVILRKARQHMKALIHLE